MWYYSVTGKTWWKNFQSDQISYLHEAHLLLSFFKKKTNIPWEEGMSRLTLLTQMQNTCIYGNSKQEYRHWRHCCGLAVEIVHSH